MPTLILIRHCESLGQEPDANLTADGVAAARDLGDRLADLSPDAVYSSPYRRAIATVAPFATRRGFRLFKTTV